MTIELERKEDGEPWRIWHHCLGRVVHTFGQEKEWTVLIRDALLEKLSMFSTQLVK